jgi:alpha/beta superfamily hydrolase
MVQRAPRAERLTLAGPAGGLEALVETPVAGEGSDFLAVSAFAVVCHPHPLYGGNLDNKVVHTLARAFNQLGAPAIRFNFRGVGTSAGTYDDGRGEIQDALAVIAWGRQRWPQAALWLGGFSFGGSVAVWAAGEAVPARLVAVAPGITKIGVTGAAAPACPWLIVQGDADDVVPPEVVLAWTRTLNPAPEVAVLPGAGHFFHGRINDLRETVLAFMGTAGT